MWSKGRRRATADPRASRCSADPGDELARRSRQDIRTWQWPRDSTGKHDAYTATAPTSAAYGTPASSALTADASPKSGPNMPSSVTLHDICSQHLPDPVPYAVLAPSCEEPLPLCVLLLGAGGTRESMFDLQPMFDRWWADRVVPPMIIATPTSRHDYYMEEPGGPVRWDSLLIGDFIPYLRSAWNVSASTFIAGISGGGYGALKLAFGHPYEFAAVAAMQPMLEPGLHESKSARATGSITPPAVQRN